jgi:hypothetical protein
MNQNAVNAESVDPAVREQFYRHIGQVPDSDVAWAERQAALRTWRSDPRFEAYWPSIDQMLADDFAALRRRVAACEAARVAFADLDGCDFDAWREQREYDLKHARDHLP